MTSWLRKEGAAKGTGWESWPLQEEQARGGLYKVKLVTQQPTAELQSFFSHPSAPELPLYSKNLSIISKPPTLGQALGGEENQISLMKNRGGKLHFILLLPLYSTAEAGIEEGIEFSLNEKAAVSQGAGHSSSLCFTRSSMLMKRTSTGISNFVLLSCR